MLWQISFKNILQNKLSNGKAKKKLKFTHCFKNDYLNITLSYICFCSSAFYSIKKLTP